MTVPRQSSPSEMETQMLEVRKAFERAFKAVILSVIVLVVSTGLAILFVAFREDSQLSEKLLVARFIQVSFGMTIGSGCVFLGVILIWLGITASVSVSATGNTTVGTGRFGLTSASPGVIIALAGIVLIALSLYRPIGYTDTLIPEDQMVPSGVQHTFRAVMWRQIPSGTSSVPAEWKTRKRPRNLLGSDRRTVSEKPSAFRNQPDNCTRHRSGPGRAAYAGQLPLLFGMIGSLSRKDDPKRHWRTP